MTSSPLEHKAIKYRSDLDGFRALAVLSVLVFHFNSTWLPGGFLGVDVFFVISGYLITSIIKRQLIENRFSFKVFYTRRIKRILPLFFTVLVVTVCCAFIFLLPEDYNNFWRSARYAMQFRANKAFMGQGYFEVASEEKPLLHLWSLAIEEQFYFIWPCVFFILFKLLKNKEKPLVWLFWLSIIGILFSTVIAEISIKKNPDASYFLLRNRAAELLVGCALALNPYQINSVFQRILGALGVLILLLCFIFFNKETPVPGFLVLIPTIAAAAFIADTNTSSFHKKLFTFKYIRLIGLWSFSLYLWHWPILAFMRYVRQDIQLPLTWGAVALGLTFLLSILSYYFIENPLRRKNFNFKRSLLIIYIIPMCLITLLYTVTKDVQTSLFTINNEQVRWFNDDEGCYDKIGDCAISTSFSNKRYLLVGDSHAMHLSGMMSVIGNAEDIQIDLISASACPILFQTILSREISTACYDMNQYLDDQWREYDGIIISQYYRSHLHRFTETEQFTTYLTELKRKVEEMSEEKPVFLISDVPTLGYNQVRKIKMDGLGLGALVYNNETMFTRNVSVNQLVQETFEHTLNAHYIDITSYVTDLLNQGELIYRDQDHLNPYGSQQIGMLFIKKQILGI